MHIPAIANLASYILPHLSSTGIPSASTTPSARSTLTFRPIHAHAHTWDAKSSPQLMLHNGTQAGQVSAFSATNEDESPLSLRTKRITIRRPKVRPPNMLSWAWSAQEKKRRDRGGLFPWKGLESNDGSNNTILWEAPDFADVGGEWDDVDVEAPDTTDRQTLLTLAKMTSNAYVMPESGEWWPVGKWNATIPFGWEADADGLRGHVFATPDNSTVVISIKGTSAGVLGSGGPTAKNDKFNDNLLFSCCCARVDFSWSTVCDCYAGGYRCEQTCVEDALIAESVYATVGTNLYNNVTFMYPNATIWLAGHSLGGSVSALIGLSFGAPVVSFEAPGDQLPAQRLHLPLPPGIPADKSGITHVYHTADPIPMGACTGAYSGCYAAGFALETRCHTGQTILYDTVTVKGWSVDIRTHRIGEIINKVLADPWPVGDDGDPDKGPKDPKEPKDPKDPKKSVDVTSTINDQESLLTLFDPDLVQESWLNWWGWGRRGPPKKGPVPGDPNDDDGGWDKHGGVPKPMIDEDCVDCYKWEFGDGWDKKDKDKDKE